MACQLNDLDMFLTVAFFLVVMVQDLVIILEAMRIVAIALSPVAPSFCWRIYEQLGYSKDHFNTVTWVSLSSQTHTHTHTHLHTISMYGSTSTS